MSCPFGKDALDKLKHFVDICTQNPDLLSHPDLAFFTHYIESLGGKVPTPKHKMEQPHAAKPETTVPMSEDDGSDPESDLELDNEGCVEPDTVNPEQKMGDPSKVEVPEEDEDKSNEKRAEAMSQFSEGNYEKAIELYTEAIELNPQSALLFSKRGQAFLKLTKPNACIKDCTRALELNPDSAAAYKFRGRAHRLLGQWEEAAKDLRQACNIDFDEQTDEWLKEVTPNAKKIEGHKLKLERKKLDREEKEKRRRANVVKDAYARARAEQDARETPLPGDQFMKLLNDPDILMAFTDPDVKGAFADITANPANFVKYQNNPKVMALITKLSDKVGGGAFPPGFPTFEATPPEGAAPPSERTAPSFTDDDNLD